MDPRPSSSAWAWPSPSLAHQVPEFLLLAERQGQHRKAWRDLLLHHAPAQVLWELAYLEESVLHPSQGAKDLVLGGLGMSCRL